jgi:hemerythrin-like metal-binding protein
MDPPGSNGAPTMAAMPRFDPSVGHDLLDAHHRVIAGCLERLQERLAARDRDGLAEILNTLWDEVLVHFASEDALMEAQLYPERTAHRVSHQLFQEDLDQLRAELSLHGFTERVEDSICRRLPDWFEYHVVTNDMPLAVHLARRTAAGIVAAAMKDPTLSRVRRS